MIYSGKFKVTSIFGNRTLNGKTAMHKGIDVVGNRHELGQTARDGEGQGSLAQSMVLPRAEHDLATEQQNPHPTLHQNKQTQTVNKNLRELTCPRPYH